MSHKQTSGDDVSCEELESDGDRSRLFVFFPNDSLTWTRREVANLGPRRTLGLASWWLKGQAVAKRPIFDGMCARCGCFLHGDQHQRSALSNKHTGPPIDCQDKVLVDSDGVPATGMQPPCLLRYSPQLFAREAPEMFQHETTTNKLSLKPGKGAPWLRPPHGRHKEESKDCTWLYCIDCSSHLFSGDARNQRWRQTASSKRRPHIPFRDSASSKRLKPTFRKDRKPQAEPEPLGEEEPAQREEVLAQLREELQEDLEEGAELVTQPAANGSGAGSSTDMPRAGKGEGHGPGDSDDLDDDVDAPEASPTDPPQQTLFEKTAEYKKQWDRKLRWHARTVPGVAKDFAFSDENLVPRPDPSLWQDAPHVPFHKLVSDESQARLSACRPISGLQEAGVIGGVPTYAHNTGEVNMRRRAPLQVASTLGFVLNQRGGAFMNITPSETEAVHECISWIRSGNNSVVRLYGTVHEKLVGAYGKLREAMRSIIPEGHCKARVRLDRRDTKTQRDADLGNTLGQERSGLVVVDPSGHPASYQGLEALSAAVAKQDVIIRADVPGPDGKGWTRSSSQLLLEEMPGFSEQWKESFHEISRLPRTNGKFNKFANCDMVPAHRLFHVDLPVPSRRI